MATTTTHPARQHALAVADRAEALGVSKADIARELLGETESNTVYVRLVLNGHKTSEPFVVRVEELLDRIEAERGADH